jgi:hypothetical protein
VRANARQLVTFGRAVCKELAGKCRTLRLNDGSLLKYQQGDSQQEKRCLVNRESLWKHHRPRGAAALAVGVLTMSAALAAPVAQFAVVIDASTIDTALLVGNGYIVRIDNFGGVDNARIYDTSNLLIYQNVDATFGPGCSAGPGIGLVHGTVTPLAPQVAAVNAKSSGVNSCAVHLRIELKNDSPGTGIPGIPYRPS